MELRGTTLAAALVLASGCNRILDIYPVAVRGDAARDGSSPLDVAGDGADGATPCYGHLLGVRICVGDQTSVLTPPNVVDTNIDCTTVVQQVNGTTLCVLLAARIDVQTSMQVTGARPLVLLGTDMIVVETGMVLDASSHAASQQPGPGANDGGCSPFTSGNAGAGAGGGGGAGGSFHDLGGAGGNGGGPNAPGNGGLPIGTAMPTLVQGGCQGGAGGMSGGTNGGNGGGSGGAVYLLAGNQITVDGKVYASGAGGRGGGVGGSGGGGGGSGGLVVLDAPTVIVQGKVDANGGGGGGGGSSTAGSDGADAFMFVPAGGGTGSNGAGLGGDGSSGATGGVGRDATMSASTSLGGGGGGGGAGHVLISATAQQLIGTISPAPE